MEFHRPDPPRERVCSICRDVSASHLGERCPHDGAVFVAPEMVKRLPLGGRYRVIEPIAEGAFAEVSVAADGQADRSVGRLVAIKRLLPALRTDADASSRFEREGELLERLADVPGVVGLVERGVTEDGEPFLALEYLDGQTLEEVLGSYGRLSVHAASLVVLALLRALDGVHGAGLIHRDLKPSNIMMMSIRDTAQLRLLDFGIARDPGRSDRRLTAPNRTLGTPSYMSPEQWGSSSVDERSDLYSLGVILYHLLTGRLPFEGDESQVANQHRSVAPPPLGEGLNAPMVVAVVEKALAKPPELRFQSAVEFYDALAFAIGQPGFDGGPARPAWRPGAGGAAQPRFIGELPRATARLTPASAHPLPEEEVVSGHIPVAVPIAPPLVPRRRLLRALVVSLVCLLFGSTASLLAGPDGGAVAVTLSTAEPLEPPMTPADPAGALDGPRRAPPPRLALFHGVDDPGLLEVPRLDRGERPTVVVPRPTNRDCSRTCTRKNPFTKKCIAWSSCP